MLISSPRQYTTVGSVYQPQPQPLQPPVRRGRTAKSLFPYKSESTTAQSQLQYAPLQQNFDRAISPARLEQASTMSETLQLRIGESSNLVKPDLVSVPLATPKSTMISQTSQNASIDMNPSGSADTDRVSDSGSDGAATRPIFTMNINSLRNLASYPNPNRRAARKVLDSHRPPPAPISTNGVSFIHASPPRIAALTSMYDQISANISADNCTDAKQSVPPMENNRHKLRVRGAPAPLTAGPPGLRQFRPTTLEQDSSQRHQQVNNGRNINHYQVYPPIAQYPNHASLNINDFASAPTSNTSDNNGNYDDDDEDEDDKDDEEDIRYKNGDDSEDIVRDHRPRSKVVDTLSESEAAYYFPQGLPPNFNKDTKPISITWTQERLFELECQSNPCLMQNNDEFRARRKTYIDNWFYGGTNMINQTFHEAVSENNHRNVNHTIGRPYMELQSSKGKVVNQPLSIRDASLPTSVHAAPLLSMVFQAMANHPAFSPNTKLPKYEHSLFPSYFKD